MRCFYRDAGNEPEQHQPVSELLRQIQRLQHARFRPSQIRQCPSLSIETHLQYQYIYQAWPDGGLERKQSDATLGAWPTSLPRHCRAR